MSESLPHRYRSTGLFTQEEGAVVVHLLMTSRDFLVSI
jgi:hypothetical protein